MSYKLQTKFKKFHCLQIHFHTRDRKQKKRKKLRHNPQAGKTRVDDP